MPIVDVEGVGEIEFPDEMTPEEIKAALKRKFPTGKKAPAQEKATADEISLAPWMRPLMQGMTFGYADELGGLGAMIGSGLAGANENRREQAMSSEIEKQRDELSGYRQRNPYTSAALEIGGAMVSGAPGLKLATTGPRLLALGAAEGGLAASGAADRNKAEAGLTGAALGGVMAGAIPAAGYLARKGSGYLRQKAAPIVRHFTEDPQTTAQRVLTEAMQSEGITPAMLKARARQMGPEATLADIGGSKALGLAQGVIDADTTGDAIAMARRGFTKRAAGQAERLRAGIDEATGNKQRFLDVFDEIVGRQKADSSAAYKAAYQSPDFDPFDKDLIDLINRPGIRKQIKGALEDAANEGRKVPALEKIVMQGDDVKIGKELMPDMEAWDHIKRRLDKAVASAYRTSDPGATSLKGARNQLRDTLDKVNPDYKNARNIYAGDAALKDALEEGENFLTRKTRQVKAFTRDLSDSERESYLTGAVEAIKEKMGRARSGEIGAFKFLEVGNAKEKLRMLFPKGREGDKQLASLMRVLSRERTFAATQGDIISGSQTALRQAGGRMVKAQTAMPTTTEALTHPIRSGVPAVARAGMEAMSGLSDKSIGELARLLYTPGNVDAVVAEMRKRGVPQQVISKYINKFSRGSAAFAPAVGLEAGAAFE